MRTIRLSSAWGIRFPAIAASRRSRALRFTASPIVDFSPSTDLSRSPATCAYTLFPSALTSTENGQERPWPSAQDPDPVSLMQPALPADWVIAPVVVSKS
jgi:hypothetical protein